MKQLKAKILNEALPYIQEFWGKTVVIKYGGSAMVEESLKRRVIQDIMLMKYVGIHPIVIHGGGRAISHLLERLGKVPVFLDGLRVTDLETMHITEMVLTGAINKEIVSLLNIQGAQAVGISGKDAFLIEAEKLYGKDDQDYGFVGTIKSIRPHILTVLHQQNFIPVISPVGLAKDGTSYNINADSVAAEIAATIGAYKLIFLTDTPGILKDPKDPTTLISTLKVQDITTLKIQGVLSDGMLPKIDSCIRALESGVGKVHILDGREAHSMILELFTEGGTGTQITHE